MKLKVTTIAVIGLLAAGCNGGGPGIAPAPENTAPSISTIQDQNLTANESGAAIGFSVTDEQPDDLTIVVSSDNQSVIAQSSLELGGSGVARTLTVTPVIDTLGDAFVTIDVADADGLSASTVFLLTLVPQQRSVQQFTRTMFVEDEADDPALINAVEFMQDADDDEFEDLLGL